jgi:hypothetical protein
MLVTATRSKQLVMVRLTGRPAVIERVLQSVTETIGEFVATTNHLDFHVIELLTIDDDPAIFLVAGTMHPGSGFGTSLFDTFNGRFVNALRDQSRSGLGHYTNCKGNEWQSAPPTETKCRRW